jgi:effector-binding domain-containing protein
MIRYFGQYNSISVAYNELKAYVEANGLTVNGPSWEEYVNNPSLETDSIKWQINIYFPVE